MQCKQKIVLYQNLLEIKYIHCLKNLLQCIENEVWVELLPKGLKKEPIVKELLPRSPGIMLQSGGSSGRKYTCLHTYQNLTQSSLSTREWLLSQGLETKNSLVFNTLPLYHISGLMPWWRSLCWNSRYKWIHPSLIRNPIELEENCKQLFKKENNPLLISLVPTQLRRLIFHPAGIRWLQAFNLIWVGGSSMSIDIEKQARAQNINLAPCYGSTETAAMITALKPKDFLSGRNDCGHPLQDIELKINNQGQLLVRTKRLAIGRWNDLRIEKICDKNGWWKSGDIANLSKSSSKPKLKILGRIDTAINSGGETIFPEILEKRLLDHVKSRNLPIEIIFLLPINDLEWGHRMVALIRFKKEQINNKSSLIIYTLKELAKGWLPAERPIEWYKCPDLELTETGKWDKNRWAEWIRKFPQNKI